MSSQTQNDKNLTLFSIILLAICALAQSLLISFLYLAIKFNKKLDFLLSDKFFFLKVNKGFYLELLALCVSIIFSQIVDVYNGFSKEKKNLQKLQKDIAFFTLVGPSLCIIILQISSLLLRKIKNSILEDIVRLTENKLLLIILPFLIIFLYKSLSQVIKILKDKLRTCESLDKQKTKINYPKLIAQVIIFSIIGTIIYEFFFENKIIQRFLKEATLKFNIIDGIEIKFFSSKLFLLVLFDLVLFFVIDFFIEFINQKILKNKIEENENNIDKKKKNLGIKTVKSISYKLLVVMSLTVCLSLCQTMHSMNSNELSNPKIFLFMIFFLSIAFVLSFVSVRSMNINDNEIALYGPNRILEFCADTKNSMIDLFFLKNKTHISNKDLIF